MAENSITAVVLFEVGKAFTILVFIVDHNCFSMNSTFFYNGHAGKLSKYSTISHSKECSILISLSLEQDNEFNLTSN